MFSLARELGMSVGRLLREMDPWELAHWQALARLERREWDTKQGEPEAISMDERFAGDRADLDRMLERGEIDAEAHTASVAALEAKRRIWTESQANA